MRVLIGVLASLLVSALCSGCPEKATISCVKNEDCHQGGIPGFCQTSTESSEHWCAFTDSSCSSGFRWGAAAGDDLASLCVEEPDAGVADAGADAPLPPDGEPPPPLSTKIIVAARLQDSLFLFSADTLAPIATASLPDRVGNSNEGLGVADGRLWVSSVQQILALDPVAVTVLSGYPKTIDAATSCLAGTSIFRDPGVYCLVKQAGTANDAVELHAGPDLAVAHTFSVPDPFIAGGSSTRIVVTYGTSAMSAAVLDANLAPVAGSPITVPGSSGGQQIAVDDELNRIAVSGGNLVRLYNRSTLETAGTQTFAANVVGLVFDRARARLVVVLADGNVAAVAADDGAVEAGASLQVAATGTATPILDAPRGRIYLLTSNEGKLAVLDAATLHQVVGSPVTLPAQARALTFF